MKGLANLVTLSRFLFIFSAALCIIAYSPDHDGYRWATLCFVVLAIISDIADGKVARLLKQESSLGATMDAVADALGFTLGFIFLSFFDLGMKFPAWFVVIVVGREVAVYGLYLAVMLKKGRVDRKPSRLAKWNTTLLAFCLVLLLLRFEYSWPLWLLASFTTIVTGIENIAYSWGALSIRASGRK